MKTILVDAINTFVIKEEGIFQEMYELLETYPNKKIILTGANDEQLERFGLYDMPYDLFTLKHNPEKTDLTYFTIMLETYGLTPDDVVYFEHNKESVTVAQSIGITAYWYDPETKNLEDLKEFLETSL